MSRFRSIPYAVLTSGLLVSGGAFAQSMSTIDQRQDYQQDRIQHGIQDGQITRSEAGRLEQGEQAINRAQARATADGNVSPQERQHIDNMVNRENREISQDSHNNQQSWDRNRQDSNRGWDRGRDGWGRDNNGNRGDNRNNAWNDNRGFDHRDGRQDQRFDDHRNDRMASNGQQGNQGAGNGWNHQQQPGGTQTGSNQQPSNGRWGNGWNHQQPGQQPGTTQAGTGQTGGTQPSNGGWNRQPTTTPTAGTQPSQPSHSWGNGGGYTQQAQAQTAATSRPAYQPVSGQSYSGGHRSR
jgi:hypothetical protein